MALHKVGGYYFTAGGSEMIADGKIGVKPGEIASFDADKYVTFTDGSREQYDLVVFATGYTGFPATVAETFGDENASKIKQVWGLDKDWEVCGVARDMGLPHVFSVIGNFMMARWFSRRVALQIIAQNDGKWSAPCEYPGYAGQADSRRQVGVVPWSRAGARRHRPEVYLVSCSDARKEMKEVMQSRNGH